MRRAGCCAATPGCTCSRSTTGSRPRRRSPPRSLTRAPRSPGPRRTRPTPAPTPPRGPSAHAAELGADPARVAVGGDSAGGNMAAVVSQETVREGVAAPVFQLLIYPAVDASKDYRSQELFREGFLLTQAEMDYFYNHYVGQSDPTDTRLSPLLAEDLSGLPPALIVTAGFDPLRDE